MFFRKQTIIYNIKAFQPKRWQYHYKILFAVIFCYTQSLFHSSRQSAKDSNSELNVLEATWRRYLSEVATFFYRVCFMNNNVCFATLMTDRKSFLNSYFLSICWNVTQWAWISAFSKLKSKPRQSHFTKRLEKPSLPFGQITVRTTVLDVIR